MYGESERGCWCECEYLERWRWLEKMFESGPVEDKIEMEFRVEEERLEVARNSGPKSG